MCLRWKVEKVYCELNSEGSSFSAEDQDFDGRETGVGSLGENTVDSVR